MLVDVKPGQKTKFTLRPWYLNDPTLADAILDRIVHGSHCLALKGESLRKTVDKGSKKS